LVKLIFTSAKPPSLKHKSMVAALQYTTDVLNKYFGSVFAQSGPVVVLGNLVQPDGSVATANDNRVIITLVNIELTTKKAPIALGNRQSPGTAAAASTPNYRLYILMSAHFSNYTEGLKYLDKGIEFFTNSPILDAAADTNMPAGIAMIEFAVENLSYEQIQSVWAASGARYQPSVVYRLNIISK